VSPVKYEMGLYIPEDDILHSHHRGNLKPYILLAQDSYRKLSVQKVQKLWQQTMSFFTHNIVALLSVNTSVL
jgi:hypothetical protein